MTHISDSYSLLAKVISHGQDRTETIERMRHALENFQVSDIDTTIPVHRAIVTSPDFLNGKLNTRWVEEVLLKRYQSHERN
jgi:acetyl-CoA carboxylase biotin carboxylase subunit